MNENDIRYEGWRVVAASHLGVLIASLHIYTLPVLLKPLAEEFGWTREEVSTAYSVGAAMVALAAAPMGRLCDRLGTRMVALPAVVTVGIAYGSLMSLSANLWHLYGVFAVLGIALIGTSPLVYARAITTWFDRRRGIALAIAISGGSVGGVVHPPMAQKRSWSVSVGGPPRSSSVFWSSRLCGRRSLCSSEIGKIQALRLPVRQERPASVSRRGCVPTPCGSWHL